ncbi:hypothetical protein SY86_25025 [Erwinia tracheiphila]|uniref:Uncharacterized protein n=1 Tax=Erwinia tracheiphila TaxID=65700 RepID=A0A0M2KAF1_9GAMM|nr:hypothetical protein SY86_25025 [Erwinia tracheiphila]
MRYFTNFSISAYFATIWIAGSEWHYFNCVICTGFAYLQKLGKRGEMSAIKASVINYSQQTKLKFSSAHNCDKLRTRPHIRELTIIGSYKNHFSHTLKTTMPRLFWKTH